LVDNCPEGFADNELAMHVREQVLTAIREPESEIGLRIRRIEARQDPMLSGSGPAVNWNYLLDPYFNFSDFGEYLVDTGFMDKWFGP
jgi:hypothetical protein